MADSDRKQRAKRRRAALRHAVFTRGPIRLSRGRLNRVRPGRDFALNSRVIHLPHLPDELSGMRITHLSDPHVGELVTPDHLPHIVEAVHELGGDMIAATGDFIDLSNKHLPAVVDALAQLRAPLGAWFVLGNHDYLDDVGEVKRAFRRAGLNLLLNQAGRLDCEGRTVAIGGIDWTADETLIDRRVRRTATRMGKADLSVLLAHHPHAFDPARRLGIDLTLSGHTHGGQVLLSDRRGKKGSIALGGLGFRYTRGLYTRGEQSLFVSSGVGSWFPWRFRCPAEITSLELRRTY